MVCIYDFERIVRGEIKWEDQEQQSNAEAEDPDEDCKYDSAKLAGIERDRRGTGHGKPWFRKNQEG